MKGNLYIVSTPIGNLEDITLRALRILKEVDIIAAEDTRRTQKLLSYYGISKPLISYWGAKEKVKSTQVLERLHSGQSVALVSDAGTPGISDPGTVLIKKAIEEGINVISIPGPSALIAALSVSGLSTHGFTFMGFLPHNKSQRRKVLTDLVLETGTLIFYEAPHRILETLSDIEKVFGYRKAAVIKEMSKFYEETFRGNLSEIAQKLKKSTIAGEYVIVVEGRAEEKRCVTDDVILEVRSLMKKGFGRKEAVKKIAESYGLSKKELYSKSLNENP
ncbi:MAG: 16S rRNA (cytidine(1402)-2'-O)-methyltransferase [Nitrospirota bacterium]|nr:16S rRNA (cytidine(1402)-2'-O)-methyltransferase [Nitrospirota bacterium]MDH5768605.1 16S rRNA (cytidine(1402)-2'-O)-methyltransferase [Nitrospirota bacterium]